MNGWAIESRVYAEDATKNFGLPSIGRLTRYMEPTHIDGVRCDSGVREGSDISIYYDPLICKLVSYGYDRDSAIRTMSAALDAYVIRGVTHNIPLLRDILTETNFNKGDISTNYLYETYPDGFTGKALNNEEKATLTSIAATIFVRDNMRSSNFAGIDKKTQASLSPTDRFENWDLVLNLPTSEPGVVEKVTASVQVTPDNYVVTTQNDQIMTIPRNISLAAPILKVCQ